MPKCLRNCLSILLVLIPDLALSQDIHEQVEQTLTQSQVLSQHGAWIPVPVPISNPTVGSGLQAVLLYLHNKDGKDSDEPNATSGIGAMFTDNETWAAGVFHDNYLFDDRIRLKAAVGKGSVNLDFYGSDANSPFAQRPVGYAVDGELAFLRILGRVPTTKSWYSGFKAAYLGSDVSFDFTEFMDLLPELSVGLSLTTLTILVNYDSRDDNYYPSDGRFFEMSYGSSDEKWNSDVEYQQFKIVYSEYFSLDSRNIIAVSTDINEVHGDTPFFLLPGLSMRGFAANKYQGEAAASVHVEWRHKINDRWGIMLSYEAGAVADEADKLADADLIESIGAGLRWQIQKDKKLNLGIEFGISDEDTAFYIVIGEKF